MAPPLILKPYERRRPPGPFRRLLAGMGLVFVAAFYGLMCTILPMQMIIVPMVPILLMTALILWMMPDTGVIHEDLVATLMVWYVGLNVMWPSYVALNAPGLPLITPTRMVVFAMVAVALWNYATSAELRARIRDGFAAAPLVSKLFWAFWAATTFSLVMSAEPFQSVSKYLNNQLYWTLMFALAAWLGMREGFAMRISRVLAWTIIIVALLSILEIRTGAPIWIDRLPAFLRIDTALLEQMSSGNARAGTDLNRVRGTFTGALYYAEYLALAFPFVVHFAVRSRRFYQFVLLVAGIVAVATAMVLTSSRAAMLALLLTVVVYGFMVAWRMNRQRPESIAASAGLFAYPVLAIVLAALVVFWRRLHVMVIGGGQHAASTETRGVQWEMGIPKVITHPFGHGVARSGLELGYYNPGSENPTVDSYFLTLLLDYGPLGLLFFVAMFVTIIWLGFRAHNRATTEEMLLTAPITVALINFIVIKSVASAEINLPIVMILMGLLVGLIARQKRIDAPARDAAAAATIPNTSQVWSGTAARA